MFAELVGRQARGIGVKVISTGVKNGRNSNDGDQSLAFWWMSDFLPFAFCQVSPDRRAPESARPDALETKLATLSIRLPEVCELYADEHAGWCRR